MKDENQLDDFGFKLPGSWPIRTLVFGPLRCIEPIYSGVMHMRNAMYDRGIYSIHDLGRPTISVGNITTGGTGKTPVVKWLARDLLNDGYHPAILMRGYKADSTGFSDEREELAGALPDVPVIADPDRIRGAATALRQKPEIDLFILDDGMQHRRAKRQVDVVLIDANTPFGFGHVLPAGLLRESLSGLKRADLFLITHQSIAPLPKLRKIVDTLKAYNPKASAYLSDHVNSHLLDTEGRSHPLEEFKTRRMFAFSGIGGSSFPGTLVAAGLSRAAEQAFPDHHIYKASDLAAVESAARAAGADFLVTTEKDWVKLARLPQIAQSTKTPGNLPLFRAELSLQFVHDDAAMLLGAVKTLMHKVKS